MNVLVIDPTGDRTAEDVFAHVRRLLQADHVGLAQTDESGCPSIVLDSGDGVFPAVAPEGVLPLVMLTCDHFDWDAELLILTDDSPTAPPPWTARGWPRSSTSRAWPYRRSSGSARRAGSTA